MCVVKSKTAARKKCTEILRKEINRPMQNVQLKPQKTKNSGRQKESSLSQ